MNDFSGTPSRGQPENRKASDANSKVQTAKTVKREPTAREMEIARLLKEEQENPELLEMDNDAVWSLKKAQVEKPSRQCPYLDTIDRFVIVIYCPCNYYCFALL